MEKDKNSVGMYTISVPKEWVMAFIVAGKNYTNRIKYLEEQERISDYKLNRIKVTTLYDLEKGMEYFDKIVDGHIQNKSSKE